MKHPHLESASQATKEAWAEVAKNISRVKGQLVKLTDQNFIVDQLQLIFKDESE